MKNSVNQRKLCACERTLQFVSSLHMRCYEKKVAQGAAKATDPVKLQYSYNNLRNYKLPGSQFL